MKIFNGKPIVKVDWGMKSNGDFETFPETNFYSFLDDSDDDPEEVSLVALVKSDNRVFGISSEGDTYQGLYEKCEWTSRFVYDFILECNRGLFEGFKYHFGDAAVLNPNGVVIAGVEGIRSIDGTFIKYEDVRNYMIEDLIPQWRLLQPGVEWDIFKLFDYLEDIYSKSDKDMYLEYFELGGTESSRYQIKNSHGFIIAEQGNKNSSDDFVGLTQEDGTFDNSPWKDLTKEKIKAHLDIWKNFGKDMTQTEIKITRDDDPVAEVEDDLEEDDIGEAPRKSNPSWFVCYEVTRYYDCCSPNKDLYDGEFEFHPETEGLVDLKKRLADYQNAQDKGMKQKNPLTEKCITIINLTKLTEV